MRGLVHIQRQLPRARPPARKVVVARDLVERQALVVIGTDPGHRVDLALFQRGVGVGHRHIHGRRAHAREHLAGEAVGLDLQAAQIIDGLDLAAKPAAHLRAGVAAGKVQDVVLAKQHARERQALALRHPGVHLARVQAERHAGVEAERRVDIEIAGRGRVAAFDHAVPDGLQHLPGWHGILAGGDHDAETAIGDLADIARHVLRAGVQRGGFVGKAGCQPPCHHGRFLRMRRQGQGGSAGRGAQGGLLEEGAAAHGRNLSSERERQAAAGR